MVSINNIPASSTTMSQNNQEHVETLSPTHLLTRQQVTQVMIEEQWQNLANNTASLDKDRLIIPVQTKGGGSKLAYILGALLFIIVKIIIIVIIIK